MAEITSEELHDGGAGKAGAVARPPVTSISLWLERFSVYAAILANRFPDKAPELLAYQATIVRAERNYEGRQWVIYDRQYRREALARRDLNWSVPNVRLYNEAFTGRARAIPRCSHCLADDHMASSCPSNLALPPAGMAPSPWRDQSAAPGTVPEICRNFNEGRIKKPFCKYQNLCLSCHDSHPWLSCPKRRPQGRTPTANRGPMGSQGHQRF